MDEDIVEIPENWAVIGSYQQRIILNDGSVLDGYAIKSPIADEVWVKPESKSLSYMDLVVVFSNPDKTSVIKSDIASDNHVEYKGYTRLSSITVDTDGKYSICLTKPLA
jgi:hypothetical protein